MCSGIIFAEFPPAHEKQNRANNGIKNALHGFMEISFSYFFLFYIIMKTQKSKEQTQKAFDSIKPIF